MIHLLPAGNEVAKVDNVILLFNQQQNRTLLQFFNALLMNNLQYPIYTTSTP